MTDGRPFLTSVETPVKGPRRNISLSRRVVIVGANAAGKSAIGQSVSLLAGGFADGIDGRNDVKGDRLKRLSAPAELVLTGTLSNGAEVSYRLRDSVDRHEMRTPAKVVRQVLQSSDKVAREFFLRWCTSDVNEATVTALVPDDLADLFRRTWNTRKIDNVVDRLLAVTAAAKKLKTERNAEAKGAQQVVDGMNVPAMPVSDADVDAARDEVEQLRRLTVLTEEMKDAARMIRQRQEALTEVASCRVVRDELTSEYDRLERLAEGRLEALTEEWAKSRPAAGPLDGDAIFHEAHMHALDASLGGSVCGCCGVEQDDESRREWIEFHRTRLSLLEDDGPNTATDSILAAYRRRQSEVDAERGVAVLSIDVAQLAINRCEAWLDERGYGYDDELEEDPSDNGAEDDLLAAQRRLEDLIGSRASWRQMESSRDRARAMKKESAQYKELEAACGEIVSRLLSANVAGFVADVNKRLAGWEFSLSVEDGFDWSIDKHDGRSHEALSGSEFETVVMALSETICARVGYVDWSVIQPDDRGWSPVNLTNMMRALSSSGCQILVESTVEPAEEVDGWTIIRLDEASNEEPVVLEAAVVTAETTVEVNIDCPPAHRRFLKALGYSDADVDAMAPATRLDTIKSGRRPT